MARTEPFEKNTAEYEDWFEVNQAVYVSELYAVGALLPSQGEGVEIGVGTGRFAAFLGIEFGVEPSVSMSRIARQRGIQVVGSIGEHLPLAGARFNYALMVTTVCFLDNVRAAFGEVHRVLKKGGHFVIGFIDKNSPVGRTYLQYREDSAFYSIATFYSVEEIMQLLEQIGFRDIVTVQTIFHSLSETRGVEMVRPGYGDGSFVVIRGMK